MLTSSSIRLSFFFFSSRRRHTRYWRDWSSDVCSSDLNFDVPIHAEDYVHRIGRTGRAGRTGEAVTLATPEEAEAVAEVEKLIGQKIQRRDRKSVVEGKRVDLGGRRMIKKNKKQLMQ